MDKRETFNGAEELLAIVSKVFDEKQPAALLVDIKGLERLSGVITSIEGKEEAANTIVTIDGTQNFSLDQVIAINGIFRADYSEC